MTIEELNNHWRYCLSIAQDLNETRQYCEPCENYDKIYSFEFVKIIMLACSEFEVICRLLCSSLDNTIKWDDDKDKEGNIGRYAKVILKHYPKIVETSLKIESTNLIIRPFESWGNEHTTLDWWVKYNKIKHFRHSHFQDATLKNAIYSTAALIISNLYLYMTNVGYVPTKPPEFFESEWFAADIYAAPDMPLPDFEQKSRQFHTSTL